MVDSLKQLTLELLEPACCGAAVNLAFLAVNLAFLAVLS